MTPVIFSRTRYSIQCRKNVFQTLGHDPHVVDYVVVHFPLSYPKKMTPASTQIRTPSQTAAVEKHTLLLVIIVRV